MFIRVLILILVMIVNGFGQRKYELECDSLLLETSLDSALSQVGITEKTGRNDGEVEKYLKLFGLKKGQPYCAAGQYWCFYTSAIDLNISIRKIPIVKDPSAYGIFENATKMGQRAKYIVSKHDLIIWRSKTSRRGHIERVSQIFERGNVLTVGFNTSDRKTGNQGVFVKRRNIYHPLGRLMVKGLIGFYYK
jgi:hypothetical protein